MNVELLEQVKQRILEHPNRFLMDAFLIQKDEHSDSFCADDGSAVRFDSCGTAACIAGWTCLIKD